MYKFHKEKIPSPLGLKPTTFTFSEQVRYQIYEVYFGLESVLPNNQDLHTPNFALKIVLLSLSSF
jgi:hypothetical protein